jgi:hypothetical protein
MSAHLPELTAVLEAVADSHAEVVARDRDLLELQAHELAIAHRFAVYLESRLKADLRRYALTIDLDYDRQGDRQKFLPPRLDRRSSDPSRFRPDLIVHRRRTNTHDLLVVEWKKNGSRQVLERMRERVQLLLTSDDPSRAYNYRLGTVVNSDDNGIAWLSMDSSGPIGDWQRVSVKTVHRGPA